jgi:hypothetical protein
MILAREEDQMKKWFRKFEAMAAAVAFTDVGEWDTAREIIERSERRAIPRPAKRSEQRRKRAHSAYRV